MDGTVFLSPLTECHEELHLITRLKVRELITTSEWVHMEEDTLFSTPLALVSVDNESILYKHIIEKHDWHT